MDEVDDTGFWWGFAAAAILCTVLMTLMAQVYERRLERRAGELQGTKLRLEEARELCRARADL